MPIKKNLSFGNFTRKDSGLEIVRLAGQKTSLKKEAPRRILRWTSFFAICVTVISKLEILSSLISSRFYNAAHRRENYESWFISERASVLQMGRDIPDQMRYLPAGSVSGYTARFLACYG